ncbi:MAG: hypothetical protein V1793_20470 [Pseudomonadota bacterium]
MYITVFLPAAVGIYFALGRWWCRTAAHWWLVLISLGFYARSPYGFMTFFSGSLLVNYAFGRVLQHTRTRVGTGQSFSAGPQLILVLGLGFNLGLDCFFNTDYHANEVGARIRTENLARELAELLGSGTEREMSYEDAIRIVRQKENDYLHDREKSQQVGR